MTKGPFSEILTKDEFRRDCEELPEEPTDAENTPINLNLKYTPAFTKQMQEAMEKLEHESDSPLVLKVKLRTFFEKKE